MYFIIKLLHSDHKKLCNSSLPKKPSSKFVGATLVVARSSVSCRHCERRSDEAIYLGMVCNAKQTTNKTAQITTDTINDSTSKPEK